MQGGPRAVAAGDGLHGPPCRRWNHLAPARARLTGMEGRRLVALLLLAVAAQARGAPPDLLVEGRVVDDATGAPIASATAQSARSAATPSRPPRRDGEGRFRLVRETIEPVSSFRTRHRRAARGERPGLGSGLDPPLPAPSARTAHRPRRPPLTTDPALRPRGRPVRRAARGGRGAGDRDAPVRGRGLRRDGARSRVRPGRLGLEGDDQRRRWSSPIDDLAPDAPGVAQVYVVVTAAKRRQLGREGARGPPGRPAARGRPRAGGGAIQGTVASCRPARRSRGRTSPASGSRSRARRRGFRVRRRTTRRGRTASRSATRGPSPPRSSTADQVGCPRPNRPTSAGSAASGGTSRSRGRTVASRSGPSRPSGSSSRWAPPAAGRCSSRSTRRPRACASRRLPRAASAARSCAPACPWPARSCGSSRPGARTW